MLAGTDLERNEYFSQGTSNLYISSQWGKYFNYGPVI